MKDFFATVSERKDKAIRTPPEESEEGHGVSAFKPPNTGPHRPSRPSWWPVSWSWATVAGVIRAPERVLSKSNSGCQWHAPSVLA